MQKCKDCTLYQECFTTLPWSMFPNDLFCVLHHMLAYIPSDVITVGMLRLGENIVIWEGLWSFMEVLALGFRYCRCLCVSVCVCMCLSVRAITHQPFKLESPNLDQRCKIPWWRSLLFCGEIDLDLHGQIRNNNKSINCGLIVLASIL